MKGRRRRRISSCHLFRVYYISGNVQNTPKNLMTKVPLFSPFSRCRNWGLEAVRHLGNWWARIQTQAPEPVLSPTCYVASVQKPGAAVASGHQKIAACWKVAPSWKKAEWRVLSQSSWSICACGGPALVRPPLPVFTAADLRKAFVTWTVWETGLWTRMKLKSQNHWLLSDMGTTEVTKAQRREHEYSKVHSGDLGLDLTWPDSHGPG